MTTSPSGPIRVEAGPTCVSRQIVVAATPHEVFELVANPHRHHEIDGSGSVKADVVGPRLLEQGDRFRVSMTMFGVPYAITSTVTRLETDRIVEWRHPGGHRWRWELEDLGDGRTRVTESFDYGGSPLPRVLEILRAPQRNADGIDASLRRVQKRFARP